MHLAGDSRIPSLGCLALHHLAYSLYVVIWLHLRVAHTSFSHWAVISVISLCLAIGRPPSEHIKAWSVENVEKDFPHLQWWGIFRSCLPYRKLNASRNSPLFKLNPWSCSGNTVNHDEDPSSQSKSIILCFVGGRHSLICPTISFIFWFLSWLKLALMVCNCGLPNDSVCSIIISCWFSVKRDIRLLHLWRNLWCLTHHDVQVMKWASFHWGYMVPFRLMLVQKFDWWRLLTAEKIHQYSQLSALNSAICLWCNAKMRHTQIEGIFLLF